MPFSHHSHSGQFCPGHARNSLEEMLQSAISRGMQTFAFTEHMPRHDEDRYPEEAELGTNSLAVDCSIQADYFKEAVRLRDLYKAQIGIPIGFEGEWIRPESLQLIEQSINVYDFDYFVGSVHHVHTIPIDYDQVEYSRAREVSGGSDEKLFEAYFDSQYNMLQALKPPVVGHFDLIRLKSDDPGRSFRTWTGVWTRILRNLDFVASYDGILELNLASLRKGMKEPYPKAEICKAFIEIGGKFCLSDDSHGIDQVALNYHQVLPFAEQIGLDTMFFLVHSEEAYARPIDTRFPHMGIERIGLGELAQHAFWKSHATGGK